MAISLAVMTLTNSIILESLTYFPLGWLLNGIIGVILFYCCGCLKKSIPKVFRMSKDPIKIYEYLCDHSLLIYTGLVWSVFSFLVILSIIVYLYLYVYV